MALLLPEQYLMIIVFKCDLGSFRFKVHNYNIILSCIIYYSHTLLIVARAAYMQWFSRRVLVVAKQNTADHQWHVAASAKNSVSGQSEVSVRHKFSV